MFCVSFYLNFEHLTGHVNIRIEFHVPVHGADAESCCLRGETRRFRHGFGERMKEKTNMQKQEPTKSNKEICCHPSC